MMISRLFLSAVFLLFSQSVFADLVDYVAVESDHLHIPEQLRQEITQMGMIVQIGSERRRCNQFFGEIFSSCAALNTYEGMTSDKGIFTPVNYWHPRSDYAGQRISRSEDGVVIPKTRNPSEGDTINIADVMEAAQGLGFAPY
ncbi:MAG: hypothetical protein HRT44_11230, partial [Bdellovibrionales bacterium]|nr:hypothetical protein [Bdellovibrionales bacterium]NQZ19813.1 hypothetical protein [Bdellovibrionales bacterium]